MYVIIEIVYREYASNKHAKSARVVSWRIAYILSDSVATPGGTRLRTQGHAACMPLDRKRQIRLISCQRLLLCSMALQSNQASCLA